MPAEYLQTFEANGNYLGSAMRKKILAYGDYREPNAYCYFCDTCGGIWARSAILTQRSQITWWSIVYVPCEAHIDVNQTFCIPGSMLISDDPELLRVAPDAMIEREFEIHLTFAEKYLCQIL